MARCPLCSERPAKRFCPAKATRICAPCCGSKREVEIDCPGDCPHLKAGHAYESEKAEYNPEIAQRLERFDDDFLRTLSPVLDRLCIAVVEEREASPWLVDHDIIEVYKALGQTMKTLAGGIHYESRPESQARASLYDRLKRHLDELMEPQSDVSRHALRVSEAVDVLEFLFLAVTMQSSSRPRSRRYLDWLTRTAGAARVPEASSSRLILP